MNIWQKLLGKSNQKPNTNFSVDELIPPQELIFIGDGDFKKIGEEFFKFFVELCHLKSNESVLDIGCGIGRMAVPLTQYLDDTARYEGFDIVSMGIDWCQQVITPKRPNFKFQLADVYNKAYHTEGKYKASEYKFPYEDNSFDFVFLTSVFTHMLPDELENYFAEIVRVLKKEGRCLSTYFLLNEESKKLIQEGKSVLNFQHPTGEYWLIDPHVPETAVAYNETFILELYKKHGLKIQQPLHYGAWCGRKSGFLSSHDIIIASKP